MNIKLVGELQVIDGFESWEVTTAVCERCTQGCDYCNHSGYESVFKAWEENVLIINVFMALQTQWNIAGMTGRPLGLRYEVVESVLKLLGISEEKWPATFEGIRIMEASALTVFNEKK